eukprot:3236177-Ditylum_brightwellii.AAC.1
MIYTSGTTGKPKAVRCNHCGPVNMLEIDWYSDCGKAGVDVMGLCANYIFDMNVHILFSSFGSRLALSLDMKKCTMLECTPALAPLLLNDPTNNVHALAVGGEACPQGLELKCTSSSTIGKPLPNSISYVVHNDDGTLCVPG